MPHISDHFSALESHLDDYELADEAHAALQERATNAWKTRQEKRSILKDTIKQVEGALKSIKSNL